MDIPLAGRVVLYVIIIPFGIVCVLLWWWQLMIFRGKTFKNPDGSVDSWHDQKLTYGIAVADITISVPTALIAIVLIFMNWRLGYYLMGLAQFWNLWANAMTTATSIRFENPRLHFVPWLLGYPVCLLMGLAYLGWSIYYFPELFGSIH